MEARSRKNENIVYGVLWVIVLVLYLLGDMRVRARLAQPVIDIQAIIKLILIILPFIGLFLVNNNYLIPKLLLKNKFSKYLLGVLIVLLMFIAYQFTLFTVGITFIEPVQGPPMEGGPRPDHLHPLIPLPLVLDFTFAILMMGCHIAIALVFQRFDDQLEKERLHKANAQSELAYLKEQINPHFYMNMLNNIHGLIEINPEKAQALVIDMSKLMRFMLYDSSKPLIGLSQEISFIKNYIDLMRVRYDNRKVKITLDLPEEKDMASITIPPLLYLVFIENAFKHGISYKTESFIYIGLDVNKNGNLLRFTTSNSIHKNNTEKNREVGIGLNNIRQRLFLLYGDKSKLEIYPSEDKFTVTLTTPIHEHKNINN